MATGPHVDKPGDAPALNTKCCEPTITGDTKVYLYVRYIDDDAFLIEITAAANIIVFSAIFQYNFDASPYINIT
jgi:hypothetical protein